MQRSVGGASALPGAPGSLESELKTVQRNRETPERAAARKDPAPEPLARDPRRLERALGVVLWMALFAVLLSIAR